VKVWLLEMLCCPECQGALSLLGPLPAEGAEVLESELVCRSCDRSYPIRNGIPRFVSSENYARTFGLQWKRFRKEQLDRYNGTRISERRFRSETGWSQEWLAGKVVLDVGCGAGRFLEIASRSARDVIGLDYSEAVDAARENLVDRRNVHLVQADIYALPFRRGTFDALYCIGVIQHTPDPDAAVRSLPAVLKPGGRIAITCYERKPHTMLYGKYIVRRLIRRWSMRGRTRLVAVMVPLLFPLTEVLFRLPLLGRLAAFIFPIADYVHEPELSLALRYRWALLDTLDMLAPAYDSPRAEHEVRGALAAAGVVDIRRVASRGVNLVGRRDAAPGRPSAQIS
jgi:ubiquinone/menaquinone biosynthesis C-methylase UbiE/uncharacterized protein YbaR (Trm112 family)